MSVINFKTKYSRTSMCDHLSKIIDFPSQCPNTQFSTISSLLPLYNNHASSVSGPHNLAFCVIEINCKWFWASVENPSLWAGTSSKTVHLREVPTNDGFSIGHTLTFLLRLSCMVDTNPKGSGNERNHPSPPWLALCVLARPAIFRFPTFASSHCVLGSFFIQ